MNVGFRIPSAIETDPAAQVGSPVPDHKFDLREHLNFTWRNWIFILSVTAFAFLIGVVYLVNATPLYTASTQVLLQPRERPPSDAVANTGSSNMYMTYSYADDQLAILRSDSLLRRVVIKEQFVPLNAQDSRTPQQDNNASSSQEQAIVDAINRLRGALAVSRSGSQAQWSNLLNIAITWEDPIRAGQLANAVADAYVVDQLDARLEFGQTGLGLVGRPADRTPPPAE